MILSAAIDHIKSTLVLRQLEDNTDLEVADASARDDAADTSSTFDQDVRRGIPIKGREDHKNYEICTILKPPRGTVLILRLRPGGRPRRLLLLPTLLSSLVPRLL
jgi:hypothetical protein